MEIEEVFHRKDAVWPFTVVGRPPQEDTTFGEVIHDLTGSVISTELPGLHSVNAVDASGVHPLLLAVGEERYTPFMDTSRPSELLTISNAILGKGQLSLAKYLLIANEADNPDIHDIPKFFSHLLERINWTRDVHFQTETSIDTLDYSSKDLNVGSKVVWAGCNAEETAVYVLVEMKDPSYIKSFGEREDIVAIREAGGADVSSTTLIAQISNYFIG